MNDIKIIKDKEQNTDYPSEKRLSLKLIRINLFIWAILCLLWLLKGFDDKVEKYEKWGGQTIFPCFSVTNIAVVQTKPKAPDPIRTPKLSGFRHG